VTVRALAALLLFSLAACGSSTENAPPDQLPESELTFLSPRPGAPPLAVSAVSLIAIKGQGSEARLEYATGEDFLRFKLDGESLLRRPNGLPFQDGDAVVITIAVVDAARMIVQFSPAGLQFDPSHPAELRLRYAEADDDLDDDGDVDDDDEEIELDFSIWRQETIGAPWERIGSAVLKDQEEVEADLTGFTRYAIGYRR
jgi:hypothetical protein